MKNNGINVLGMAKDLKKFLNLLEILDKDYMFFLSAVNGLI